MTVENDHNTWVYHALKEAKIVKASEAKRLYKKGWRDSADPKVLFKGFRGKWYRLIVLFRKFANEPKKLSGLEWIGVVGSIASILGLIIALLAMF